MYMKRVRIFVPNNHITRFISGILNTICYITTNLKYITLINKNKYQYIKYKNQYTVGAQSISSKLLKIILVVLSDLEVKKRSKTCYDQTSHSWIQFKQRTWGFINNRLQ